MAIPAIEIYLIITVGSFLGTWPTLGIIAVTAVVGAALAKSQGTAVLQKLQRAVQEGEGAGQAIAEGVMVLVAGVTLLAPGFVTDAVGLALLIPRIRARVAQSLVSRMTMIPMMPGAGMPGMGRPPGPSGSGSSRQASDSDPPPPGVIDI